MKHYLRCSQLAIYERRYMRLSAPDDPQKRAQSRAALDLPDEVLTRRALALAAAYRVHCSCRSGPPFSTEARLMQALEQAAKEAARGHARAAQSLDRRWVTERCRPVVPRS